MFRYSQRGNYAFATPSVTRATHAYATHTIVRGKVFPNHLIRWRPHRWPRKGITAEDPATIISSMRNTYRPTPDEVADKHKRAQELAYLSSKYKHFIPGRIRHEVMLKRWEADGPPPLSEYKLTFGKHKGKRLYEVPDSYLVKYLIPRAGNKGQISFECPLVIDAVEDFQKRHPEIKSQAGKGKTQAVPNRSIDVGSPVRKGRKTSARADGSGESRSKDG